MDKIFVLPSVGRVPTKALINITRKVDLIKNESATTTTATRSSKLPNSTTLGNGSEDKEISHAIENVSKRFELKLSHINGDYEGPDISGLDKVLKNFRSFLEEENLVHLDVEYMLHLKLISSSCAVFLVPNFTVDSLQIETMSTFMVMEWLLDDVVDNDTGMEDFFNTEFEKYENLKLVADLIKHPTVGLYKVIKFPRKEAIWALSNRFHKLIYEAVPKFNEKNQHFNVRTDELHDGQIWIVLDEVVKQKLESTGNKQVSKKSTEDFYTMVEYRRMHTCGAVVVLELSLLFQDITVDPVIRKNTTFKRIYEVVCIITSLINDIFSIDREITKTDGQNCVAHVIRQGKSFDEAMDLIISRLQNEQAIFRHIISTLEFEYGASISRFNSAIQTLHDGTIFWHRFCPRYKDGSSFEILPIK